MVKLAINGFGRIGKQFFLACMENSVASKWEFVINNLGGMENMVYELKYDSVHPSPKEKITHDKKYLYFGKKKIMIYSERDVEKLPWKAENVDLVVDCTGAFTNAKEAKKHLQSGAKKVLISAPAKDHDCTIVYGVNNKVLKATHKILSAGSCTTNCVAPIIKIINDNYGIKDAYFVTTHAYTATQRLVDSIDEKDLRRGRAAAEDIIPSTSGASQSVVEAIPEMLGKLEGYALRVPVLDGSFSSVIAVIKSKTTKEKINSLFKKESKGKYKEILQYTTDPIVSSDIIHNPSSCIIDGEITSTSKDGSMISIGAWYDNEWGYSNRLVDVAKLIVGK
ncbi:MAG: type I glyceraldehyde-3-phosphate dehydrogenase [Nanoarchaeota archaeon]